MIKLAWPTAVLLLTGAPCWAWQRTPLQIPMGYRGSAANVLDVGFFGDSYSAGPGAGDRMPNDNGCLRFDQSYPMQLEAQMFEIRSDGFTFESCTGAESTAFPDQIGKLDHKLDAAVISFGGKS